eukprot:1159959-Pelagomonas_calceolata.AAC.6
MMQLLGAKQRCSHHGHCHIITIIIFLVPSQHHHPHHHHRHRQQQLSLSPTAQLKSAWHSRHSPIPHPTIVAEMLLSSSSMAQQTHPSNTMLSLSSSSMAQQTHRSNTTVLLSSFSMVLMPTISSMSFSTCALRMHFSTSRCMPS